MPKRKWNRLHDEETIANERDHRSRSLREQQEARDAVAEGLVERLERPVEPAPEREAEDTLEESDGPPKTRRKDD